MAGHSQYSNIKRRKEAQDAKKAKIFTKLARAIEVAARSGADPNMNSKLRTAITTARKAGMPGIDKAIAKGSNAGSASANYDEVRYECRHGSSGICFIISALTDNRNRTASDVKSTLSKYGATLATPGSVAYMFDNVGRIEFVNVTDKAALLEKAIDFGAIDIDEHEDMVSVYVAIPDLERICTELEASFGESKESGIVWRAKEYIEPNSEESEKQFFALLDVIESFDDVQSVFANVAT